MRENRMNGDSDISRYFRGIGLSCETKRFDNVTVPAPTDTLKQMIANILILLAMALAASYALACLYALASANSMIFPAPPSSYQDDESIVKIQSCDGNSISALYLEATQSRKLLLYSHGNGEDLGYILPFLQEFQRRGISVLAYDYPGYGTSSGTPSEKAVYAAADAVFEYARQSLQFPSERIVLYGRSLGSGPSCWLAERHPVAGLILDGAFSSTFRVMTRIKLLPWDVFDNLKRLPEIDCPVLILHGEDDLIVPFEHALANEKAAQKAQTHWIKGAGHNNHIEVMGEDYWRLVFGFIGGDD
jgi:pimeloyl-ACP methyl ester carboxylesterase